MTGSPSPLFSDPAPPKDTGRAGTDGGPAYPVRALHTQGGVCGPQLGGDRRGRRDVCSQSGISQGRRISHQVVPQRTSPTQWKRTCPPLSPVAPSVPSASSGRLLPWRSVTWEGAPRSRRAMHGRREGLPSVPRPRSVWSTGRLRPREAQARSRQGARRGPVACRPDPGPPQPPCSAVT